MSHGSIVQPPDQLFDEKLFPEALTYLTMESLSQNRVNYFHKPECFKKTIVKPETNKTVSVTMAMHCLYY